MEKGFHSSLLEQIKSKINLVDLVREVVVLKRSGSNYQGLCPFHSERSPSFFVVPDRHFYYCFGCKASGDAIAFLMQTQALSFSEAVLSAASFAEVSLEGYQDVLSTFSQKRKKSSVAFKMNKVVATLFQHALHASPSVQRYLEQRGISKRLWDAFFLGYAASDRNALFLRLKAIQAPIELAKEMGLFHAQSDWEESDHFIRRLMFPFFDLQGRITGFAGRTLDKEGQPKYLNSSESFLFDKSSQLFGIYQAKPYIREKNCVLVVEGYTDVLACVECGFLNTVATCGTSITKEHLSFLKKMCTKIVMLYDGDTAGQTAMARANEVGCAQGLNLYGVWLSNGDDPHSFLWDQERQTYRQESIVWLEQQLKSAVTLLDHALKEVAYKRLAADQDSNEQARLTQEMAQILHMIKDPVSRKQREYDLIRKYRVPVDLLKVALQHVKTPARYDSLEENAPENPQENPQENPTHKADFAPHFMNAIDESLLYAMIHGGAYLHTLQFEAAQAGVPLWFFFDDTFVRQFVQKICQTPEQLSSFQKTPEEVLKVFDGGPELERVVRQAYLLGPGFFNASSFENMVRSRREKVMGRMVDAMVVSASQSEKTLHESLVEINRMVERMKIPNKINLESKRQV